MKPIDKTQHTLVFKDKNKLWKYRLDLKTLASCSLTLREIIWRIHLEGICGFEKVRELEKVLGYKDSFKT